MYNDDEHNIYGDEEYKGNGYSGISMSNNAVAAYNQGKKPLSKWRKKDILAALKRHNTNEEFIKSASKFNLIILKRFLLECTEYHHTGMRYTQTDFYNVIGIRNQSEANMLLEKMEQAQKVYSRKVTEEKISKKNLKPNTKFYLVKIEFSRRSADGRHLHVTSGEGVIHGNWCYLKNRKKKKTDSHHFTIIKHLGEMPNDFSLEDYYDDQYQYESHWVK